MFVKIDDMGKTTMATAMPKKNTAASFFISYIFVIFACKNINIYHVT